MKRRTNDDKKLVSQMLHCEFAHGRHSGGAVQVGEDSQYDARSHIKKMSNTMFVYKVVEAFRHLQEQSGQLEGTKDVTEWTAGFGFFFLCLCSVCLWHRRHVFLRNCRMEKGCQNHIFDARCFFEICDKTSDSSDAQPRTRHHIHVVNTLRALWCVPQKNSRSSKR